MPPMRTDFVTRILDAVPGMRKEGQSYVVPEEVDVAVLLSMPSEVITVPRVAHLDTMNELLVIMTHKGERFVFPLDVLVGVKSQQGEKRSGARSAGFR